MILVTGANGQIGTVLTEALRDIHGTNKVIATDIRPPAKESGPFVLLDTMQGDLISEVVKKYKVTQVYHLVALLSASGEKDHIRTWNLNMQSLINILEVARQENVQQVFFPSSIAVFGDYIHKPMAGQHIPLVPETMYGVTKVAGENLAHYYHHKFQLDVRSLRYPGIISYQSAPGGGTTDYAVDIFHKAVQKQPFTCFLEEHTRLPMIYMDDAIDATLQIMNAPASDIHVRTSYNLAGCDFTPGEISNCIKKYIPDFKIIYAPDYRQQIAESWPQKVDDESARRDWGWAPEYDLEGIVNDMIKQLAAQYHINDLLNC